MTPAPSRGRLLKVLGTTFGISVAVGNAIAAGIVRAPGDIAQWLPSSALILGVWMAGGLYALFGASSLAELSAAIPRSGGQYNFARRAIGEYAGFIVGWSDWLSTCGTLAVVAIVIGEYSGVLLPALAGREKITAISMIIFFAILQERGVRWGSWAQIVTSLMKTAAFVILIAGCFFLGGHARIAAVHAAAPAPSLQSGWALVVAVVLGLQAIFYTMDGWDGVIYFGGELRNPGVEVPRSIFSSVFTIILIYICLNAAILYVLPMNEIAGNKFALGTVAEKLWGPWGDPIIRIIMVVSLMSCLNSAHLFCSRILHSMSCDGLFFRRVASVNKGGTPALALLLSTVVAVLFVLGTFERLIAMLSFFFVANYTLSYVSLFMLRRKEPALERPYRAWGYPWTTGIALLASILFLVISIATDRENAPRALAMLVLSYPLYRAFKWMSMRHEVKSQA